MFHSSKNTFPFIASALGPSPRPVAGPAAAAHASHLETLWGPCRPSVCALCGLDSGTPDSRPSSGLSSCCESLSPSGRHGVGGTWGRGDPLSSCALPGPRLGTTLQCGTLRPSLADQAPAACCLARLSLHGHRRAAVSAGSHGPPGASVELWGGRRRMAEGQPNPDSAPCWPCELGQGVQPLRVSVSILVADTR